MFTSKLEILLVYLDHKFAKHVVVNTFEDPSLNKPATNMKTFVSNLAWYFVFIYALQEQMAAPRWNSNAQRSLTV